MQRHIALCEYDAIKMYFIYYYYCVVCVTTGVGGFMVRHRSSSKGHVGLSKESGNPLMASELMEG